MIDPFYTINCDWNWVAHMTVAKLRTNDETFGKGGRTATCTQKNKIHSIALKTPNGASSTLAAHMQTMSLLSDHQHAVLDPSLACDAIAPALEVEEVDRDTLRNQRVDNIYAGSLSGSGGAKPMAATWKENHQSTSSTKGRGRGRTVTTAKNKPTTAAAFFKSEPAAKNSASKRPNTKPTKPAAAASNSKSTKAPKPVQKEKVAVPEPKRGNADDFVGDEDEDEDFLREEEERKKRQAKSEKKKSDQRKLKEERSKQQVTRKPMPRDPLDKENEADKNMDIDITEDDDRGADDDDNSEGNGKESVRGAMDAFATKKMKKEADPEPKGRKRRKQVLEEKTFVDENGFFRTETVSVWKEIEEEDEEEAKAKASSSLPKRPVSKSMPKNTKKMKQQGLMGFFDKKS